MKLAFSQVYIELGAGFPFSVHFQRLLTNEVTALVRPSGEFVEAYGDMLELGINVSAKHHLDTSEIRGPTVFKKSKAVEFTIFLPFDVIMSYPDAPKHALQFLLKGVCDVLDLLKIDKTALLDTMPELIDTICTNPKMLAEPSWNPAENSTPVRRAFAEFFEKGKTS
jgi:hypothetical protein